MVEQVNSNKSLPVLADSRLANTIALIFFCLSLIGIVNHEMWLDELQGWLIARDSSSLFNLFKNLKYEGHPGLWHFCLYLITKFTHHPISMQFFHILISTLSVYIYARNSSFSRLNKILFSFGYFPFYEYSIISRNYAFGILFSFLFCAAFPTKAKSHLLLAILLVFLANTDFYGLIIAIVLGGILILDYIIFENSFRMFRLRRWDLILSLLIYFLGLLAAIIQIIPPKDYTFVSGWITSFKIQQLVEILLVIGKTYVPIPNFFTYQFWNSSLFTVGVVFPVLGVLLSLGLLIFVSLRFIQKPVIFFPFIIGTSGMLAFMYLKYIGSLRHSGHLFILFITCSWLANYYPESQQILNSFKRIFPFGISLKRLADFFSFHEKRIIIAILCTQLFTGSFAFTMDLYYPFSVTKEVSQFIKSRQMSNILVVADIDYVNYVGPPLSAYLDKKVYYLNSRKPGFASFLIWNRNRGYIKKKNTKLFFKKLEKIISLKKEVLLVMHHKLSSCRKGKQYQVKEKSRFKIEGFTDYCWQAKNYFITKVAVFKPGLIPDENPGFYLYIIRPKQQ